MQNGEAVFSQDLCFVLYSVKQEERQSSLIHPSWGPGSMSTATVTLLFTDLEASTELLQNLGDKDARQLWRMYFQLVRAAATAKGGQEVKSLGDGLMIVFPSARDAIGCAVATQRDIHRLNISRPERYRLQVRIGLHVGEPIQEEEDYFGTPVVIARRLCDCAKGGQILASDTVRGIVGATKHIDFVDRGLFTLKGIVEQWRLYEVPWQRDEPPATVALATLDEPTRFVDREKEFAELQESLERVLHGQGNLILIGGEPGVGKTRLVAELENEGRQQGFLTLVGHCYETATTSSYLPFIEILESAIRIVEPDAFLDALGDGAPEVAKLMPELRKLFPDISPPAELPPEQARRSLFNGFCEFVTRAGGVQPLLLVAEDLQWADEPSLLLLQQLAQHLPHTAALIVGTYRDVELDVDGSLARIMQDLLRQRVAYRLHLGRLSEADVSAMLNARSGHEPPPQLVRIVYNETEGNPFFVEEIFRHLAESGKLFDDTGLWRSDLDEDLPDVPQSIRLVVGQRLQRLSEECRHVLTAAAIIGRGFSFTLLEKLTDIDENTLLDAVETAERAQLIHPTGKRREVHYLFTHELIRQTLVSGLSLPRRQRLHLRVAEAMEQVYVQNLDERAAELAYHLYQAGAAAEISKTIRYLTLSGDRAFEAAAFEEALRSYKNALSLQAPDDVPAKAGLLFKHGLSLRSLGRSEEAIADWSEVLELHEQVGDAEAVGHLCAVFSTYLFSIARFETAFEIANRGLVALNDLPNSDHCLLLAVMGFLLSNVPAVGYDVPLEQFARALGMARELKDERLRGKILGQKAFLHHAYWQGKEAIETGLRSAELIRNTDPYEAGYPLTYGGQCGMLWLGRLKESARIATDAEALAKKAGNEHVRWFSGHYDSFREVAATGNLAQFEKRRKELLDIELELKSGWVTLSYAYLGLARFWRGRWEEAQESFQKCAEMDIQGHTAGLCDSFLFLLAAYSGNKEDALVKMGKNVEAFPRLGQPNAHSSWSMLDTAVEGMAMIGESHRLAELYPVTLEAVASGNLIRASYFGLVQTSAGIAAAAGQLWEKAEEHFRIALRQAHEIPYRVEQPEVRRWYARMLIERNASGDKEKARSLLSEAVPMYRDMEMPRHLAIAEELMVRAQST